jgi:signal peptidase I
VPGLGQVYNGQAKKGVLFWGISLIVGLGSLLIMLGLSLAPVNIVGPILLILCLRLYIILDAIRTAQRLDHAYQLKAYNKWYIYCVFIVLFAMPGFVEGFVDGTLRHFFVQAFKIPSTAMETTLLVGDHILVNKFLYRFSPPQRFDVLIFPYPWEEDRMFIKRVIGLPGDRVYLRDRQVYVNDRPLDEPYARYMTNARLDTFGPVVVPKKGDRIEIRSDKRLYLNGEPVPIPTNLHHPADLFQPRNDGAPMTGLEVFYGQPVGFPPGTTVPETLAPRLVEDDYYFVLGDNRDNSQDSRYWGFVRRTHIIGLAQRIYWSWNSYAGWAEHLRWWRIGQSIR